MATVREHATNSPQGRAPGNHDCDLPRNLAAVRDHSDMGGPLGGFRREPLISGGHLRANIVRASKLLCIRAWWVYSSRLIPAEELRGKPAREGVYSEEKRDGHDRICRFNDG